MLRNLCWGLSVGVATASAALVITGVAVGTLRPFPPDPEPTSRDGELRLLSRNAELAAELTEARERHLRTLVLLDELRRSAILFPPRPSELAGEDLIPPQRLPVNELPEIPLAHE